MQEPCAECLDKVLKFGTKVDCHRYRCAANCYIRSSASKLFHKLISGEITLFGDPNPDSLEITWQRAYRSLNNCDIGQRCRKLLSNATQQFPNFLDVASS